ncbi:1-phosphatidylinositol 3-phosphate 5-kinase [Diorhabda sublineata]|uniref:1-phosphatidylinositol 3-phosphate 5-kinase n=1 Tax=Diorhabda sublineata TaxID=1163346 RepID=UPI0024E05D47|nr:1-phosphatidylinositol 3-phosphate 5-kinase [Diorhabda sublineata]
MSEDLETTNKLTEFGRLEDPKPNTVGQCLANFFWKRNVNVDEINSEKSDTVGDSLPTWAADVVSDSSFSTQSSSNVYDVDVNEGRSLPNVLKRISNLLALKSSNLKDYGDTNLKQYWMQDSVSKECYECSEKFTFVRRKHHCRVCGQIFCSQCCNQQIPGKIFGCTGKLKACTYCCKVVLSYLESSDFNAVLTNDLKLLQESLQSKFGMISPKSLEDNTLQTSIVHDDDHTAKRKISVGYQEENFFSENTNTTYLTTEEKCRALQNSTSLRNLFEEMCKPVTGLQFESHRYRLKTYTDCFLGSELVDWLIFQQKSKNRIQASAICQALLEGGYIESVSDPTAFIDGYAYYYKKLISYPELSTPGTNFDVPYTDEPHWVQQIPHESSTTDSDNEQASPMDIRQGNLTSSSSYLLDLNLEANTVYLSRPPDEYKTQNAVTVSDHQEKNEMLVVRPTEQIEIAPESGWFNANNNLREENEEKLAYTILSETFEQHEHNLLKQLLLSKGLSYSWWEIIIPLLHEIIGIIRPDKNHDATDLDIRHYVQFKILSGGLRSDTTLIGGIVCSKNVAHKDMLTDIENPKILLLECSIVYQRTEGRLMSLEPVLMQEYEYLKNVVTRISALKPNVVLVQKNISRIAQDMLLDYNITLVHNVKQSVLERLSRCTKADIVSSVDAHIGVPKLGTCKRFYVNSYKIQGDQKKTLMFFEGLPNPHLGSTVLLRGGSETELSKLKDVSVFMLFALYSWRLEKSYLMDEFAMPPNPNEFLDDNTPDTPEKKTEEQKRIERPVMKRFSRDEQPGENRKILVDDFTDPLQSKQEFFDVKSTGETLAVAELPFSNNFKKQLDDTILCVSPYVVFSVPYLETETGKKCKLRRYFPDDLYFSVHFENNVKNKWKNNSEENRSDQIEIKEKIKPLHPFLLMKLTESGEDVNVQNLLAHFRACGGRYEKKDNICIEIQTRTRPKSSENNLKDVLDPANHQKLAVLFCSYSTESNNAPAFCVNPWIVYMDFYGRNDIPLGCFLERYCFRSTYNCPSKSCDTSMVHHVRRFVHNVGCVTICLNHFDNEFYDDHIVMWTWCTKCQKVSPVVPMSVDTWSYSFAKYLELKFYGDVFSRRGQSSCNHSLHHDHYQYFGYKNYVATFKYSQITILEVSLPPPLIEIKYDNNKLHDESIDGIKNIAQKGHDLFSLIQDKLKNVTGEESESNLKQILLKEQNLFKQKIEEVQLKLTSPSIECKQFDEKVLIGAYWNISDSLTKLKRNVVEIVDIWNVRFNELARKKDVDKKKEKSNVEDILDYQESNVRDEKESINRKIGSFDNSDNDSYSSSSPKSHHRSQSESAVFSQIDDSTDGKKESDKKSVKTILSSLLPSSNNACVIPAPFSANEHYNLSDSSIPLIVFENQPSSIVSYTLASNEYRKLFDELSAKKTSTTSSDVSNSPVTMKRKSYGEKDKTDDDKTKNILGFLKTKEAKIDNANQINSTNVPEISFEASQIVSGPQEAAKKVRKAHVEVQFQEGSSNFFCRVYLAEQFAKLRAAVLPMGEEAYIRSLSRSVQWDARGGKSGSNFSKTVDDRFILKEMSKSEVDLFLESSSNYFAYMNKCHTTKQLTLLGKILGIYQIVFKNNSSVPYRSNILVMENLFYNRKVSQKFDLKGSMRNRLVVPDNQGEEIVLLDENLMKMTCDSPLYVLQHSKSVLINAIQNDTEFLSTQSVMDYSLLVGLDPDNKELILGIIDYIRTFTWDKRLETMVKKSGILGGQGKLPTIISPEEYQKRFIEAMHRYFLEVPDHWAGLSKTFEP